MSVSNLSQGILKKKDPNSVLHLSLNGNRKVTVEDSDM